MLNRTLKNFGQTWGFKDLAFNENNVIHLTIDEVGEFYLEDDAPNLILYILNEVERPDIKTYLKALRLCHYREKQPFPLSSGLFENNQIAFLTRLNHEEISLPNINKCVTMLNKAHQQLTGIEK